MHHRGYFLLAFLLLGDLVMCTAQQPSTANPFSDLLIMQMNWDALKSDDNAKPSVALNFVSFEKHKQDGKSFTSYHVYAPGLPQNKAFTLIQWPIGWDAKQPEMQPVYSDLYVNARGVLMCKKPTEQDRDKDASDIQADDLVNVIVAGSAGEPDRLALYTEKDGIVAMGRLIVKSD